jgi:hypothetical protein
MAVRSKMFVLQPDEHLGFVKEPYHPMLPPGPGLYTLQEPSLLASGASSMRTAAAAHASESARLARSGTTHLGNISPKPASVGKQQRGTSLALFPAKPKAKAEQVGAAFKAYCRSVLPVGPKELGVMETKLSPVTVSLHRTDGRMCGRQGG